MKLDTREQKAYRMMAARLNFMAQDNPAIQFAAKEACRKMSSPEVSDFVKLKNLARFVAGVLTVEWEYPWQSEEESRVARVWVDSD